MSADVPVIDGPGTATPPDRTGPRVVALFRPYRPRIAVITVTIIFSSGLGAVVPFLTQEIFDRALFPRDLAGGFGAPDRGLLVGLVASSNRVTRDLRDRLLLILSWRLTLVAVVLLPVFVPLQVRVGRVRRRVAGATQRSLADGGHLGTGHRQRAARPAGVEDRHARPDHDRHRTPAVHGAGRRRDLRLRSRSRRGAGNAR